MEPSPQPKMIPSASFYLYLLDKNGKRVGEGYLEVTNASTPVDVARNTPAGAVEMELTPSTLDTVVWRDETVVVGDLVSMSAAAVNINIKGKPTKLDRSRIARLVLGQRKHLTSPRRPRF